MTSHRRTTISGNRPAVSNPKRSSHCGFWPFSGLPAKAFCAAVLAFSSLILCLRADGATITCGPIRARQRGLLRSGPDPPVQPVPLVRLVPHQKTV